MPNLFSSFVPGHGFLWFVSAHGVRRADRSRKFAALAAAAIVLPIVPAHAQNITFRDITAQAGKRFTHHNADFGKEYMPETIGPHCAVMNDHNEGFADIPLIHG